MLEAVGDTPLLELARIGADVPGLRLLAKAEHMNPCGSVKDRPVRAMLLAGIASGKLTAGKTILEATSGNTGIADAMLGRALGFPVTLFLPSSASPERQAILRACGAELILTDPLEGTDGAIREARRAAREDSKFFYPDQYSNPANWRAHFETTGPEIWTETGGRLTHFVAGLGTSGTFVGVSRFLKAQEPLDPLRVGRAGGAAARPGRPQTHGKRHGARDLRRDARGRAHRAADRRGLGHVPAARARGRCLRGSLLRRERRRRDFASPDAGLAGAAGTKPDRPIVIVTVLCDRGERYLSEDFWRES